MDAVIILSAHGDALGDPGAIGWAWIDHIDGRFDAGGAPSGTEQSAGLTAVLRAIEAHPGTEPLLVESASQQAIRVAAEWLPSWKANGWRTSAGDTVPDADIVRALDDAVAARPGPVRFRHVRGHIDSPYRERATRLAQLSAADWAAGRGSLDGFLIADMPPEATTGPVTEAEAPVTHRAPEPDVAKNDTDDGDFYPAEREHHADARAPWESATLF
ncbi:hypothetical protein GCM10028784_37990 [Myceligenerans cantabricum]